MRTFIVAEIGCNHNGSPDIARAMIREAKACGVDAVKFQAFKANALISRYAPKAAYQKETTGNGGTQLDMTKRLELAQEDLNDLQNYATTLGLEAFSTAFDMGSAQFLAEQGQRVWKIPSGEVTNLPLLRYIGSLKIPDKRLLVSTGMCTVEEVRRCLDVLMSSGASAECITILHCNTEYPTPDRDVNLSGMVALREAFPETHIGFSDHSVGSIAALGAVALGAEVIEKHFTLSKLLPGPDHKASATPEELRSLCSDVRRLDAMLGDQGKYVTGSEKKNKVIARKSIIANRRICKGEAFSEENITCKRPGNGISPMLWDDVVGRRAERDFFEDELIEVTGISWQSDEER